MSPATPDNGGEATPQAQPVLPVCPHCGGVLPPLAFPVARLGALERKLSSAAYPFPQTEVDARKTAPTERLQQPPSAPGT